MSCKCNTDALLCQVIQGITCLLQGQQDLNSTLSTVIREIGDAEGCACFAAATDLLSSCENSGIAFPSPSTVTLTPGEDGTYLFLAGEYSTAAVGTSSKIDSNNGNTVYVTRTVDSDGNDTGNILLAVETGTGILTSNTPYCVTPIDCGEGGGIVFYIDINIQTNGGTQIISDGQYLDVDGITVNDTITYNGSTITLTAIDANDNLTFTLTTGNNIFIPAGVPQCFVVV